MYVHISPFGLLGIISWFVISLSCDACKLVSRVSRDLPAPLSLREGGKMKDPWNEVVMHTSKFATSEIRFRSPDQESVNVKASYL